MPNYKVYIWIASMEIVTSQIRSLDYVLILHDVLFYLVGQSG